MVVPDQQAAAEVLSVENRQRAAQCLIDVLADLHAVDPDQVGLGDLGRRTDYVGRQLRRWQRQLQSTATAALRLLEEVHDRLLAAIPPQIGATLVHGDFRLGNTIIDHDGRILAVLDWELCTLGDPLADLGWLVATWTHVPMAMNVGGRAVDGFPQAEEVVEGYARRTGRDTSKVSYYVAFNLWRFACIIEGVRTRYAGGAMGQIHDAEFGHFADLAAEAGETALNMLVTGGPALI
jgi:aminoglycoside phosphotransferase (APT) family kinase protein